MCERCYFMGGGSSDAREFMDVCTVWVCVAASAVSMFVLMFTRML